MGRFFFHIYPLHSSYVSRSPSDSYFCFRHIFNVVSTAILSILLILSAVSAFVLSSSANIHVRALIKRVLLVYLPINLSKSSCTRFVDDLRKSKTPSVKSVSILFSSKYSSSSLLISSKISVVPTSLSTSICLKPKRFLVNTIAK